MQFYAASDAQRLVTTGAIPPKAIESNVALTIGMLTRIVLTVAVRAMDTAEKAKAVGSLIIAAVPRPCALPP